MFLANLPPPAPGSIETWLLAGAAVLAIVALWKQVFVRKPPIEVDLATLRRENDFHVEKLRAEMLGMFGVNTQAHGKIHEKIRDAENVAIKIGAEIRAEMKRDQEKAHEQAESRIARVQGSITEVAQTLGRIEGRLETQK